MPPLPESTVLGFWPGVAVASFGIEFKFNSLGKHFSVAKINLNKCIYLLFVLLYTSYVKIMINEK